MDRITLKGIKFYGFHGVLPKEKEFGQFFNVDIELFFIPGEAGVSDDLDDAINYAEVHEILRDTFYKKRFKLLEALAEAIAHKLLLSFPVKKVIVSIRKPHVPLEGDLEYAELRIERKKS